MLPIISRVLALGCVGAALSACVATQAQVDAALNPATATTGGMVAAGTTGAQLQQLAGYVKQARATAIALCGIEPTVASVANIAAALAGASSVVAPAAQIANLACSALTGGKITHTAMETKPAKKPAAKPVGPKEGDPVSGTIIVNGEPVVVRGTVVEPAKAK
jgi:hypothetical protein